MERFDDVINKPGLRERDKRYNQYVAGKMPKTKTLQSCIRAFWVGGVICCIGQAIADIFMNGGMDTKEALGAASVILVIVGATLTGLGVYDIIGKYAGAGSVVPISGFANSIVAPAMEHKREGLVPGIGTNIFRLAGPVLLNGITASIVVGLIYFFFVR